MKYYSKSTTGFYDSSIHTTMPQDAVQISDTLYADLLNGQSDGQTITADTNGNPILVSPPTPTLDQVKATQIAIINQACQMELNTITAPYPSSEISTWPAQLADAIAYTANDQAPTPMLSPIAAASGQTVASLAALVLSKAAVYQAAAGAAIGKRQALTAEINAATTVATVQAAVW